MEVLQHPDITRTIATGYPIDRHWNSGGGCCTDDVYCEYCGEYVDEDLIHNGCCYDCAKKEFDYIQGLAFLKYYKLEEDFFLSSDLLNCFGMKVDKKGLLEFCINDFIREMDNDDCFIYSLKNEFNKRLKEDCFEDMRLWIEFLFPVNQKQKMV